MASGITLHAFNWENFKKLLAESPEVLAEKIVTGLRESGYDEEMTDLFKSEVEPVAKIKQVLSSQEWYAREHHLDEETIDEVIQQIFETEMEELEIDTLGCGVDWDIPCYAAGLIEVDPDRTAGIHGTYFRRHSDQASRAEPSESEWLGGRPFLGFDKQGAAVTSSKSNLRSDTPLYSIHSPAQVQQLYQEALSKEDEVQEWEDEGMVDNYISDFLEPIEVAANNNLAIFAMGDT